MCLVGWFHFVILLRFSVQRNIDLHVMGWGAWKIVMTSNLNPDRSALILAKYLKRALALHATNLIICIKSTTFGVKISNFHLFRTECVDHWEFNPSNNFYNYLWIERICILWDRCLQRKSESECESLNYCRWEERSKYFSRRWFFFF